MIKDDEYKNKNGNEEKEREREALGGGISPRCLQDNPRR